MEYVFEDFIFGFIDKEIDSVKAKSQNTSTYLLFCYIVALCFAI